MKPYPLRKEQLRVLRLLLDGNSYPTAAFTLEYYRPIVALHTLERRGLVEQCGTSPTAFVWRITPEGRAAVQETAVKYVPDVETLAAALQDTARASQPTAPWIQAAYDALPDAPLSTEVAAAAEWVEARACDSPCVGCHDGKCDRLHATTILRALTAAVASEQRLREAFEPEHQPWCPAFQAWDEAGAACTCDDLYQATRRKLAATPATGLTVVDAVELAAMKDDKNQAYLERNHLVALVARMFPSGIRETSIEGWDAEWNGCVYIDLPDGQISYHYHTAHAWLFADLPPYTKEYDGHGKTMVFDRQRMAWAELARLRAKEGK